LAALPYRVFEDVLAADAKAVEARLEALLPDLWGNRLREAMRYAVLGQGKRLRPFFVLESCRLHNVDTALALDVACALECVHCYSLVHDDLPAMDNDDLRRGQPTTHKKFDEATAILAGDGLLTFAFEILTRANAPMEIMLQLAKASGPDGMVGGQMLDIEAETKNFASIAEISNMQNKKTGALFRFGCMAGPIIANADLKPMQTYADCVGLAFQIADDVLDVESSTEMLGKATQKDKAKGKATFVDFLGLQEAKAKAKRMVGAAVEALRSYGENAGVLEQAAHFMIERRK
jgi:farnesyl diphosphate synthase